MNDEPAGRPTWVEDDDSYTEHVNSKLSPAQRDYIADAIQGTEGSISGWIRDAVQMRIDMETR